MGVKTPQQPETGWRINARDPIFLPDPSENTKSWAGSIVVVARNEEEARKMASREKNYSSSNVFVYDIKPGHIHTNLGEL